MNRAVGTKRFEKCIDRVMRHLLAMLRKVSSGQAGRVALCQQVTAASMISGIGSE